MPRPNVPAPYRAIAHRKPAPGPGPVQLAYPLARALSVPTLAVAAGLLIGGCSLLLPSPPLEPLTPPWDSLSPPPIGEGVEWTDPDPIQMGLPPAPGRYTRDIDVIHYEVELVIPPENDRISSRTVIRYVRPDRRGPHPLILDFTGLSVEAVTALANQSVTASSFDCP